jgi:beta-glucosidase-like glycosyl hydrolase
MGVGGTVGAAVAPQPMPRRPPTPRELQLRAAEQALRFERAALKQQQAKVAAARRALARLTSCDQCGGRQALPGPDGTWTCWPCARAAIEEARRQARLELQRPSGSVVLRGMARVG